jgi:Ca2+-binding RTX toxin-like protein
MPNNGQDAVSIPGTDAPEFLSGGPRNDTISGGLGNDTVFGGAGADTILGDTANGPSPPSNGGTPGNNLILAGAGDDTVVAGYGSDTVLGGSGDDLITGYGVARFPSPAAFEGFRLNDGPDLLVGGAGADTVDGGGGADTILGGADDDLILGGFGVDLLAGGSGGDVFVFARDQTGRLGFTRDTGFGEGERDVILDFEDGRDRIDLTGYRNPVPSGPQPAPLFLGEGAFVDENRLQVRIEQEEDATIVQIFGPIGTPPDEFELPPPQAIVEIELRGRQELTADNFIL